MNRAIFITATGTDVGKTYVTGLLLRTMRKFRMNAGYYKAALSGAVRVNGKLVPGDAQEVLRIAQLKDDPEKMVSYQFEAAVSPHLAAQWENSPIDEQKIKCDFEKAQQRYPYLCVEGSGGLVCPLHMGESPLLLEDVIQMLSLPILIVADAGLGTINHTVLTVAYARSRDIAVRGIILNRWKNTAMQRDNLLQIERLTEVPVVAVVAPDQQELPLSKEQIEALF